MSSHPLSTSGNASSRKSKLRIIMTVVIILAGIAGWLLYQQTTPAGKGKHLAQAICDNETESQKAQYDLIRAYHERLLRTVNKNIDALQADYNDQHENLRKASAEHHAALLGEYRQLQEQYRGDKKQWTAFHDGFESEEKLCSDEYRSKIAHVEELIRYRITYMRSQ